MRHSLIYIMKLKYSQGIVFGAALLIFESTFVMYAGLTFVYFWNISIINQQIMYSINIWAKIIFKKYNRQHKHLMWHFCDLTILCFTSHSLCHFQGILSYLWFSVFRAFLLFTFYYVKHILSCAQEDLVYCKLWWSVSLQQRQCSSISGDIMPRWKSV